MAANLQRTRVLANLGKRLAGQIRSRDSVAVSQLHRSNKKDAEATKLWHLRLGHAGERSLQILAKQRLLKEVWSGKPATDYDYLRIFGSIAYYHVTESKLDPRAKKALFMGFSAGVKGYRLWCLESKKTIVSRDVTFDESSMLNKVNPNSSDTSQQVEYTPKQVEFEEAVVIPTTNTTNDSPTEEEESDDEEVPPQEPSQQSEPIAVRRTRRENKKPARFADMVAYALPVVDDHRESFVLVEKICVRSVQASAYDKNPEENVNSTVVPDNVIPPQPDEYWAPHPKTGVFGPATDENLRPGSSAEGTSDGGSVLEEKAFFRPLEDLEKPPVQP
ncbi:hypothetical protein SASPL_106689 [Salvia splendens]|uniref:GAG-pre-integrase domain-containing protein n=1 Tax=Salvia splendens TaxID=180675 RepID=A0A8X8YNS3_SALSN|nr:hypothetical protein SASPL_106689 [Salvia splendens]